MDISPRAILTKEERDALDEAIASVDMDDVKARHSAIEQIEEFASNRAMVSLTYFVTAAATVTFLGGLGIGIVAGIYFATYGIWG